MKILLLSSPFNDPASYGKLDVRPYSLSLGIAYLAGVLEKENYPVRAVDLHNYTWAKVEHLIKDTAPSIVGITCLTKQRASVFRLVRLIKSINRGTKIVLGGIHPHFMYQQILEHEPMDAIVFGEGEVTFGELIKAWESEGDLHQVKGIAFKNPDGVIVRTPPRELISNLDTLPFPAYHFFNLDDYCQYGALTTSYRGKDLRKAKFVSIIASRGCVGHCQFCSTPQFWGGHWRKRSARNVVDEIEMLHREYQREVFNFADDIFTVNEQWVIEICKEIMGRGLDILWDCETRVNFVSAGMLRYMKEAGCYSIAYGVESASPAILKAINKKALVEEMRNALAMTKEMGIRVHMLLMVGNPGESDETIQATARLLKELKPDSRAVNMAMVFPGTALYELAKSQGMLDDNYWLSGLPSPFYTVGHSLAQLHKWVDYLTYVSSTGWERIIRKLRSLIVDKTGIYITKTSLELWRKDKLIGRIFWK